MLNYAPRLSNNFPRPLLNAVLTLGLGLFCVAGSASAQTHGFSFRDYGSTTRPALTPPDEIKAVGALLMDGKTGEILYARNPHQHLLPASTTKLMTALIVYEKNNRSLKGNLTIIDDDTRVEPSSVPLIAGETVSVDKLFHALLIESANDTARALGRYVAGSTDAFVQMMNEKALAMGCFDTHFYNPNGLPAPAGTHYTCCADLMQIFRAVLKYPELREICRTREYKLTTAAKTQILRNHNRLLGVYPGMDAAKTGWTVASRHTYAASAIRGNRELLLIILDSPNKWYDAEVLFNWGFAQTPSGVPATTMEPPPFAEPVVSSLPPAPAGRAPRALPTH